MSDTRRPQVISSHGKSPELQFGRAKPGVVLVVGVNGGGKTTTIGKLAHKLNAQGRKGEVTCAWHVLCHDQAGACRQGPGGTIPTCLAGQHRAISVQSPAVSFPWRCQRAQL